MSKRRRSRSRRPARRARLSIIPRVSGWLPFYAAGMLTSALIVGDGLRQIVSSFLSSPVVALAVPLLAAFWWNATHSTPPAPVRTTPRPRTTKGKGSASLGASATARPRRETTSIAPGAMRDAAIRAALPTEEATAPSEMTFRSDPTVPASRRLVTGSARAAGAVSTAMHRAHARLLPDPLARQIAEARIDLDE